MKRHQCGYFLIEALIAMMIFALGALGIVNLYGSLQTRSQDAQFRVVASQYANEILSMIIADNTNATCYTLPTPGACSSGVATTYITGWLANVNSVLPVPVANPPTITIDNTNRVTIVITWRRNQDVFAHNYTLIGQI